MSPALLATGALVLLVSGIGHLRTVGPTSAMVVSHQVVPPRLAGPVSVLLLLVELVLGAGLLVAVLLGTAGAQRGLGLVCAGVFVALAGYAHLAWREQHGAPALCACGVGESPLGPWVSARALLLGGITALGALSAGGPGLADRAWTEVVILVCATTTLALVTVFLPAARALPAPATIGGFAR